MGKHKKPKHKYRQTRDRVVGAAKPAHRPKRPYAVVITREQTQVWRQRYRFETMTQLNQFVANERRLHAERTCARRKADPEYKDTMAARVIAPEHVVEKFIGALHMCGAPPPMPDYPGVGNLSAREYDSYKAKLFDCFKRIGLGTTWHEAFFEWIKEVGAP